MRPGACRAASRVQVRRQFSIGPIPLPWPQSERGQAVGNGSDLVAAVSR
jgi:hypothetical protein